MDAPVCPYCSAYKWKEERPGFCCEKGSINFSYDPDIHRPGAIPPHPPDPIKALFEHEPFLRIRKLPKLVRVVCNAAA